MSNCINSKLRILNPSTIESIESGGTSNILPDERNKATFNISNLTDFINCGENETKRRKFIEGYANKDTHLVYNQTKTESQRDQIRDFIALHKQFPNFKPNRTDLGTMSSTGGFFGSLNNSLSIFAVTIIGQGNAEQQQYWVPKILNFEITGSYAQTELGIYFLK